MTFRDDWIAARRVFILRLLSRSDGEANEQVICTALEHGGFGRDTRDAFRADLDHLRQMGCLTEDWFEDVRVVTLTERGTMAAEGRVVVLGVEQSPWRRR